MASLTPFPFNECSESIIDFLSAPTDKIFAAISLRFIGSYAVRTGNC